MHFLGHNWIELSSFRKRIEIYHVNSFLTLVKQLKNHLYKLSKVWFHFNWIIELTDNHFLKFPLCKQTILLSIRINKFSLQMERCLYPVFPSSSFQPPSCFVITSQSFFIAFSHSILWQFFIPYYRA